MTTRYRLTLDIELSPNGDTDDAILFRLKQVAAYGLSNGTIIGDGPADVVSHEVKAEKLPKLSERLSARDREISRRIRSITHC